MSNETTKLWARFSRNELLFLDRCTLDFNVPYRSRSDIVAIAVEVFLEKVAAGEVVPYDTMRERRSELTFNRGYNVPVAVLQRFKRVCAQRRWSQSTTARVALAEFERDLKRQIQQEREEKKQEREEKKQQRSQSAGKTKR